MITFLVLQRLFKSPFGRAVRSVREDDTASLAFGRNVYLLKLKAYILGGCVAGLGGALLASYITAFNPYGWTPQETFLIYAALFIGGTGNALGAIIGTFFVEVGVQEVTRYVPQIGNNASSGDAIRLVLIGLMIVGILWWRPRGVLPEQRGLDLLPGEAAPRGPGWRAVLRPAGFAGWRSSIRRPSARGPRQPAARAATGRRPRRRRTGHRRPRRSRAPRPATVPARNRAPRRSLPTAPSRPIRLYTRAAGQPREQRRPRWRSPT